jgi:hypothetical protein
MLSKYLLMILSLLPLFASAETVELWSNNKKALAVCMNGGSNECYVAIGTTKIDITRVERANLGKLGIRPLKAYSKIVNFPSKWLQASNNEYMINITTQAWFEGQRYTVTEPVYIKGGVYHQR